MLLLKIPLRVYIAEDKLIIERNKKMEELTEQNSRSRLCFKKISLKIESKVKLGSVGSPCTLHNVSKMPGNEAVVPKSEAWEFV